MARLAARLQANTFAQGTPAETVYQLPHQIGVDAS
jgi:hypothetical protein